MHALPMRGTEKCRPELYHGSFISFQVRGHPRRCLRGGIVGCTTCKSKSPEKSLSREEVARCLMRSKHNWKSNRPNRSPACAGGALARFLRFGAR